MLQFDDGVTELSFLLRYTCDGEGDETAMIELILGQRRASLVPSDELF